MNNFFVSLGKFFNGLSIFLTIIHHIVWSIIGIAILVIAFYIMSNGGPGKIIQQALPSQLQQSSSQNSNQQNSSQQNQSNNQQANQQEFQCTANILGQTRANQLQSGSKPTAQEQARIKNCFPAGFSF